MHTLVCRSVITAVESLAFRRPILSCTHNRGGEPPFPSRATAHLMKINIDKPKINKPHFLSDLDYAHLLFPQAIEPVDFCKSPRTQTNVSHKPRPTQKATTHHPCGPGHACAWRPRVRAPPPPAAATGTAAAPVIPLHCNVRELVGGGT